ncbi:Inositol oxygenase 2, partial [Glycine soja]
CKFVEELYQRQHMNQTYNFAKKMREEYGKLNKVKMSIWECCEMLDKIVDVSDPDLEESQIQHALQTAETVRKDYFGKALLLPSFGGLPQWAVVGESCPLIKHI